MERADIKYEKERKREREKCNSSSNQVLMNHFALKAVEIISHLHVILCFHVPVCQLQYPQNAKMNKAAREHQTS